MLPLVTITAKSNVNKEVAHAFETSFKNAVNQRWYRIDKNYMVKFILDDQKNTALFKKNGALIYHISYGFEKDLPDDIRDMVKSSYALYTITRAVKVNQDARIIWVINLGKTDKLVLARVENGILEEVGDYNKSE